MSCGEREKAAKTEHTPEPWIAEGSFIGIPNGKGTFYMSPLSGINQERRESDARRIVACVNSCAGLSTGFLEQIDSIQSALTGQLVVTEVLEKQRDELLADKMRLDFLDGNMRFKMGWYVGAAPVGNLLISSVIQPSGKITSIREAIDAAIDRIKGSAA